MSRPRAAVRAAGPPPPDVHGTTRGYYRWACLCVLCRAAARAYRMDLALYHQVWRGRRQERAEPPVKVSGA